MLPAAGDGARGEEKNCAVDRLRETFCRKEGHDASRGVGSISGNDIRLLDDPAKVPEPGEPADRGRYREGNCEVPQRARGKVAKNRMHRAVEFLEESQEPEGGQEGE